MTYGGKDINGKMCHIVRWQMYQRRDRSCGSKDLKREIRVRYRSIRKVKGARKY